MQPGPEYMKIAIIFGAGASAAEGAPIQRRLLIDALETFSNEKAMRRVAQFLERVFLTDTVTYDNAPTFEEVLTLIDMFLEKRETLSSEYGEEELLRIRKDLIYSLWRVLEDRLEDPPGIHKKLVSKVFLERKFDPTNITFLSLNYDRLLDDALLALKEQGVYMDYVIDFRNPEEEWSPPLPGKGVPFLKLHGSLNWLYCPTCSTVRLTPGESVEKYLLRGEVCEKDGSDQQVLLVPPSWHKEYVNPYFVAIWHRAERELRQVGKVVFIGYSLPESDIQVRYLLGKSLYRREEADRPEVLAVLGRGGESAHFIQVRDRYLRFFGRASVEAIGFEGFVDALDNYL